MPAPILPFIRFIDQRTTWPSGLSVTAAASQDKWLLVTRLVTGFWHEVPVLTLPPSSLIFVRYPLLSASLFMQSCDHDLTSICHDRENWFQAARKPVASGGGRRAYPSAGLRSSVDAFDICQVDRSGRGRAKEAGRGNVGGEGQRVFHSEPRRFRTWR